MPKSVLVADDSLTIRKVIGMLLTAHEDFSLTMVDNGLDAIARAREMQPDLVLADCMMPGKSGYEVCETIKNDPSTAHIPVMLLAGTFEPFDETRARMARADGHIAKPFDSTSFLDRVKGMVGITTGSAMPVTVAPVSTAPVTSPAARPMGAPVSAPPPAAPGGFQQPRPMPGMQGMPGAPGAGLPPRPMGAIPGGTQPGMARPGMPPAPGMPPRPMGAPGMPPGPGMARPGMPPQPGMARPGMPPGPGMGRPGMPGAPGMPPRPMGVPGMPGTMPPGPGMARPGMPPPGMPPQGFPRPPGAAPLPGMGAPPRRDPYGLGQPAPQPHQHTESLHLDGDGGEAVLRDALSKASKEVIEKIAWEVVPQLAETIIREELDRLIKEREAKGLA